MFKKNFFSIITVVFNNKKSIQKCIDSVNNQSFKNYEHIVIDGNSIDGTKLILAKNKTKIKYFSKQDINMWDAMNKGIKKSKGNIICILNSDDILTRNALKIANKYFLQNIDYFFGAVKKRKVLEI